MTQEKCPVCANPELLWWRGNTGDMRFVCERCVPEARTILAVAGHELYFTRDGAQIVLDVVEPEAIVDERLSVDDLLYESLGYYS